MARQKACRPSLIRLKRCLMTYTQLHAMLLLSASCAPLQAHDAQVAELTFQLNQQQQAVTTLGGFLAVAKLRSEGLDSQLSQQASAMQQLQADFARAAAEKHSMAADIRQQEEALSTVREELVDSVSARASMQTRLVVHRLLVHAMLYSTHQHCSMAEHQDAF